VEQPDGFVLHNKGFVLHNKGTHVCKLRKALYGLKQAPRVWYDRIDGFLKSLGFQKSDVDANLYFKVRGNQPVKVIMYVDDLFLTRDEGRIDWCKRELTSEFEMKNLGLMHYFLGMEVWQKTGRNIPGTRKIHCGCTKEVRYDGLQIHVYSDDYQPEEAA
jgi:hypothetical protein